MSNGVTGTHIAGETGKISDDNARDLAILYAPGKRFLNAGRPEDQAIVYTSADAGQYVDGCNGAYDTLGMAVRFVADIPAVVSSTANMDCYALLLMDGAVVARRYFVPSPSHISNLYLPLELDFVPETGAHYWALQFVINTAGQSLLLYANGGGATTGTCLTIPRLIGEFC